MKIRIASDLHIEFYKSPVHDYVSYDEVSHIQVIPRMENEKEQILILAGDITMAKKINEYIPFFTGLSERFKQIFYVMGNHEHYRWHWKKSVTTIKEALRDIPNLMILDKESVVYDDVLFVGATLWTDFRGMGIADEVSAKLYAESNMSDFFVINGGPEDNSAVVPLKPWQTVNEHETTLEIFRRNLEFANVEGRKVVVISHHAPSSQSSAPRFKGSLLNAAFYSNLEDFILKYNPALWVHGHMHNNSDYMIGDTRVICNPLGYGKGEENHNYVQQFVVEL